MMSESEYRRLVADSRRAEDESARWEETVGQLIQARDAAEAEVARLTKERDAAREESEAILRARRLSEENPAFRAALTEEAGRALMKRLQQSDEALARLRQALTRCAAALIGVALTGVSDEGHPTPLQAWCDDGWTCEHPECVAGRAALCEAADLGALAGGDATP